jgi:MFS transporter, MHS family, shikimate and dehydroshikimate transport protein
MLTTSPREVSRVSRMAFNWRSRRARIAALSASACCRLCSACSAARRAFSVSAWANCCCCEKIKNLKAEAKMPVIEAIRNHPKNLLVAMGMRFAENGLYYIITVFSLTYCVTVLHLGKKAFLPGLIINYCIGFFAMLLYGRLSDTIGRRVVYMWGAAVCGVLAFPFFWMMNKAPQNVMWGWLAIILMAQLGHSAMYGPQASFFAELFPARVRYSGASLGYQFASIFAGGMAPVVATALLAKAHNKTWPVSLYMLSFVVITIIAVIFAEETYKKKEI